MKELEKYIVEMGKDVEFDEFNLKETQLKLPALKHKWVGRLVRSKYKLKDLQSDRHKRVRNLAKEMIDTATYSVTLPTAEKAAAKHKSIVELDERIKETELIIEFLEKGERIFSSMSFDIKNITEIMKLETL